MEFIVGHLEAGLAEIANLLEFVTEAMSVGCIMLGLATVAKLAARSPRMQTPPFLQFRLRFGAWLALALEFQLAADILETTIAPSWERLGKLGAIALIRTFLNYFLNKEIEGHLEKLSKSIAGQDGAVGRVSPKATGSPPL